MATAHYQHNDYQRRRFAETLDFFRQPIPGEIEERTSFIVAAAKLRPSDRVLDIGTGTGALIRHIKRWGVSDIVGCDLCEEMLREAREKFPDARFWCGDVMHLPEAFGNFDACFLNAMFGNLWNQSRTLRFLATRVVEGGRLIISHPLGARFVAGLHASDPQMVPHRMPDRNTILDMLFDAPLKLTRFVDDDEFYLCVLTRD